MTRRRAHTLEGDLESFPPPLLFQMMALGQLDGVLTLGGPQGEACQVQFRRGKLAWACGPEDASDIGADLVRKGLLDREAHAGAVRARRRASGGESLGGFLVTRGCIGRDDLETYLRARIEAAVYAVLEWRQGRFHFDAGARPESDDGLVDVELESLLLECMTRLDDARRAGGEADERRAE